MLASKRKMPVPKAEPFQDPYHKLHKTPKRMEDLRLRWRSYTTRTHKGFTVTYNKVEYHLATQKHVQKWRPYQNRQPWVQLKLITNDHESWYVDYWPTYRVPYQLMLDMEGEILQ